MAIEWGLGSGCILLCSVMDIGIYTSQSSRSRAEAVLNSDPTHFVCASRTIVRGGYYDRPCHVVGHARAMWLNGTS